jgi:uncharacterized pyridoxal phosphate-containing UPF0001 family protein
MVDTSARIADNLAMVRGQIAEAAARSGRAAGDVTLVAVTKYVSADMARRVAEAGCLDLGESRPQQLWEKFAALDGLSIRWHLVGHLQRNKVRRTLPAVAMVHSVDSMRLLAAIDEEAGALGSHHVAAAIAVLLEVNISGEPAKHGFPPEASSRCWPSCPAIATWWFGG